MLQVKPSGNSDLHAAQPELSLLLSRHAHPTEEKKCENRMKTSEGGSAGILGWIPYVSFVSSEQRTTAFVAALRELTFWLGRQTISG